MNKKQLEENIEKADEINRAIAKGKEICTSIYWGGGICPKVQVLTISPHCHGVVKILENTKEDNYGNVLREGEIIFYFFADRILDDLKEILELC